MKDDYSYVLAFGSNLDEARMAYRCPGAVPVGTTMIKNHRLAFRRSATGFYATLDVDLGMETPAVVWKLSKANLRRLDGFEGYPICYDRKPITTWVRWFGSRRSSKCACLAYVLPEVNEMGMPTYAYFSLLDKGYERWGFRKAGLYNGLIWSAGYKKTLAWLVGYETAEKKGGLR